MKLIINNSYSILKELTPQQFKEVRELLSYSIPESERYFSGHKGSSKRYLIDKRGEFPTGLLPSVLKFMGTYGLTKGCVLDTRKCPEGSPVRFNLSLPVTPYQCQENAVATAVVRNRGTISAITGLGKSIMMALLVQRLQLRSLIVVPNLGLKRQLKEAFLSYFGSLEGITIENIDSPELDKPGDYDVLIIDEAHHVAAKTYRTLNKKRWGNIYHRYFFTATPFRTRDEENMLFESIAGEVIYRIDYKEAVKIGAIVPVEAYYIDVPTTETDGYSWAEVYKALVVHNDKRNSIIHSLLRDFYNNNMKTLCLVKEIKHGEKFGWAFANGQNDETQNLIAQFNCGAYRTLIGTTGVLGEGVDTKPCEVVIIAGLGKSRGQFMQQVGRGLRRYPGKESCKVIIFRDRSHKWTKAHFNAQVKFLKQEYGCVPARLVVE